MNDLPTVVAHSHINLFADDTEVHASSNTIQEVKILLQQDVNSVVEWFKKNKLIVNLIKCCCMIISTNRNLVGKDLDIFIDGEKLMQVQSTKYLGVTVDSKFSWSEHVSQLCSKLSPKVGLLRRLKHILPRHCFSKVYMATIQPHIDYCLTVWGHTAACHLDTVQKLQSRAARILTGNYDWNVRGLNLVRTMGWQNVTERRDYLMSLLVFKSMTGIAPFYLQDLFTEVSSVNSACTRSTSNNKLYIPKPNKEIYKQSLGYRGSHLWNGLPDKIRNKQSLPGFKCTYKTEVLGFKRM